MYHLSPRQCMWIGAAIKAFSSCLCVGFNVRVHLLSSPLLSIFICICSVSVTAQLRPGKQKKLHTTVSMCQLSPFMWKEQQWRGSNLDIDSIGVCLNATFPRPQALTALHFFFRFQSQTYLRNGLHQCVISALCPTHDFSSSIVHTASLMYLKEEKATST